MTAGRGTEMVSTDAMDVIQKMSLKPPLCAFDATAPMRTYKVLRISEEVLFSDFCTLDHSFILCSDWKYFDVTNSV